MADYKEGPLPPRSDHEIDLDAALDLVRRYRKFKHPAAEKGGFFWADPVRKMLDGPEVVGLRYYHGVDEKGGYHIILIGVDKDGRDIVRHAAGGGARTVAGGEGQVLESTAMTAGQQGDSQLQNHWPCPPFCSPDGPFA